METVVLSTQVQFWSTNTHIHDQCTCRAELQSRQIPHPKYGHSTCSVHSQFLHVRTNSLEQTVTGDQYNCSLEGWLFEYVYSRRHLW